MKFPTFTTVLLAGSFCVVAAAAAYGQKVDDKKPESTPDPTQSKIKVTFDENTPGVVYVEANGERIRVNVLKRTVEDAAANAEVAETKTPTTVTETSDKAESPYDFDKGDEPYDYRVVNVPTPRSVPKKGWALAFTHRFSETIDPIKDSARDLFGLDSFGIASFGISYGFTDKLYGTVYRSPLCQKGLCRTVEVGLGYNLISMDKESRVAVSGYASIEGNDNFTEEYTYNLQARLAYRPAKRLYLFFSPAAHLNSNGQRRFDPRPTDFFPPAPIADTFRLPTHGASFGFGGEVLLTPNVVALIDFVPRTGFKLGRVRTITDPVTHRIVGFFNESHPSFGFGVQRNVGKHAFSLTLSNTQSTTTSRYNSSNADLSPKHLTLGFNLTRRF